MSGFVWIYRKFNAHVKLLDQIFFILTAAAYVNKYRVESRTILTFWIYILVYIIPVIKFCKTIT